MQAFISAHTPELLMIGGFCTVMVLIWLIVKIKSLFKKKPPAKVEEKFMNRQDCNKAILKHLSTAVSTESEFNFGQILKAYRIISYKKERGKYIPIDPASVSSKDMLLAIEHEINQRKTNNKFEI